jgi:hypothetical protein
MLRKTFAPMEDDTEEEMQAREAEVACSRVHLEEQR